MNNMIQSSKFGFANTVPMFSETKQAYGVWNKLQEKYVNTVWCSSPEEAIEVFDEQTVNKSAKVRVNKSGVVRQKVTRERDGSKAAFAAEMNAQFPQMDLQALANEAHRRMSGVSSANFRYLINKIRKTA